MEDLEIYQLAGEVLSTITSDLNNGIYSDLKGELSLVWSEVEIINAWAESKSNIDLPPQHKIGIHFELVRQIYRDIEALCGYLESNFDQKVFDIFFKDYAKPLEMLPSIFSTEARITNMFIGAITWVFFHELGHLKQEHGYIRSKFIGTDSLSIQECYIDSSEQISSKASAIFHATEMAADFEAINSCISELIRHFKGKDLKAAIYLFVCGVSCVLYRFHGANSLIIDENPNGSHPNPIVRLENIIPQIYEFLSIPELHEHIEIELPRKIILELCNQAAVASGVFWLRNNTDQPDIPENYFLMGNLNRPMGKNYLSEIINVWDEIEPTIKSIRRFGTCFGILRFSKQTRDALKNIE